MVHLLVGMHHVVCCSSAMKRMMRLVRRHLVEDPLDHRLPGFGNLILASEEPVLPTVVTGDADITCRIRFELFSSIEIDLPIFYGVDRRGCLIDRDAYGGIVLALIYYLLAHAVYSFLPYQRDDWVSRSGTSSSTVVVSMAFSSPASSVPLVPVCQRVGMTAAPADFFADLFFLGTRCLALS